MGLKAGNERKREERKKTYESKAYETRYYNYMKEKKRNSMVGDVWDSWKNEVGTNLWSEPCTDDCFNLEIAKYKGWKGAGQIIIFSWFSKSGSLTG